MGLDSFSTAAAARDLFVSIAEKTVNRMRPEPRIGQVVSVDESTMFAECLFAGETETTRARFYSYNKPKIDDIVRVYGKPGNRWISDVITQSANYSRTSDGAGNWGEWTFSSSGAATRAVMPHVRQTRGVNQTISNGVETTVDYSVPEELIGSPTIGYSSGVWTISRDGLYLIIGSIAWDWVNTTGRRGLFCYVNSSVIASTSAAVTVQTANQTSEVNTAKRLEVGDTVKFNAYQNSGGDLDIVASSSYNFASISFIGD